MLAKILLAFVVACAVTIGGYTLFRGEDGTAVTDGQTDSFALEQGKRGDDPLYSEEIKRNTALTMQAKDKTENLEKELEALRKEKEQEARKTKQMQDQLTQMIEQLRQTNQMSNDVEPNQQEAIKDIVEQQVQQMNKVVEQMQQSMDAATEQNNAKISALQEALAKSREETVKISAQQEKKSVPKTSVTYAYGASSQGTDEGVTSRIGNTFNSIASSVDNIVTGNKQFNSESGRVPTLKEEEVEWPTVFPVYTLPQNTVLSDSTLITPIIGRVPLPGGGKSGNISDPFFFKVEIGAENLAANGQKIPGVAKMIASGYATGVREQSCVRGYIDSLTFIFIDGRIVTQGQASGDGSSNGDSLGYLADKWGKPCIRGMYINNAKDYLMSRGLAAFVEAAAGGLSQSQVQTQQNSDGTTQAILDGNVWQYVLGQGIGGTASELAEYVRERTSNAFDVVYVDQAKTVQIWLSSQIEIDYDANARKINYYEASSSTPYYD